MADLPSDRLEPAPPFSYCAVDFFGPFIEEGRKELKRWGAIFVCMVSRGIHIEVAASLDTTSFLNAYRRFVCRRGPVRILRSDQGTNFIGGRNELTNALTEMDDTKISRELIKENCDWINFRMNAPHSSHMAGTWERMIHTVRGVLSALLQRHGQQLNDELLHTFLIEAEAIVNSRPLSFIESDTDVIQPLSPMQLLTLKASTMLPPPGDFVQEDVYCRRRWRRVQYLSNQFWSKWRSEYVHSLQQRNKWHRPQRNVSCGDIVLLVDDNAPRCQWRLARVVDPVVSSDGLVRKAKVKVQSSVLKRPIHEMVYLCDGEFPDEEPTTTA